MPEPATELQAIYFSPWMIPRRLVFRFKVDFRREIFEVFRPLEIREALKEGLERIEQSIPGSLAKACQLDDEDFQSNKRRKRRYIAEEKDLLYLDNPRLTEKATQPVADFWVITNIAWRDVPNILRLVCRAAGIQYGAISKIGF